MQEMYNFASLSSSPPASQYSSSCRKALPQGMSLLRNPHTFAEPNHYLPNNIR